MAKHLIMLRDASAPITIHLGESNTVELNDLILLLTGSRYATDYADTVGVQLRMAIAEHSSGEGCNVHCSTRDSIISTFQQ